MKNLIKTMSEKSDILQSVKDMTDDSIFYHAKKYFKEADKIENAFIAYTLFYLLDELFGDFIERTKQKEDIKIFLKEVNEEIDEETLNNVLN